MFRAQLAKLPTNQVPDNLVQLTAGVCVRTSIQGTRSRISSHTGWFRHFFLWSTFFAAVAGARSRCSCTHVVGIDDTCMRVYVPGSIIFVVVLQHSSDDGQFHTTSTSTKRVRKWGSPLTAQYRTASYSVLIFCSPRSTTMCHSHQNNAALAYVKDQLDTGDRTAGSVLALAVFLQTGTAVLLI